MSGFQYSEDRWPDLDWDNPENEYLTDWRELIPLDDVVTFRMWSYTGELKYGYDEIKSMIEHRALKIVNECTFYESDECEPLADPEITNAQKLELLQLARDTDEELFQLLKQWQYYVNQSFDNERLGYDFDVMTWGDLLT